MKPVEAAFAELLADVREVPGPGDNPRISAYLATCGVDPSDETSWCSAFVQWCCEQAGAKGSKNAAARSWLKVGKEVTTPQIGDVVIFWRVMRSSWQGHVAFYVGEGGGSVLVLGGNQGDRISIAPYSKERVLGYRRI